MSLATIMLEQLAVARRIVEDGKEMTPAWRIETTEGAFLVLTRFDTDKPEQRARAMYTLMPPTCAHASEGVGSAVRMGRAPAGGNALAVIKDRSRRGASVTTGYLSLSGTRSEEERSMANKDEPHEIEKIIARRKVADATKATAAADAKRETQELAARVKEAFLAAQKSLQAEIKKANEAIRRGGRTEEFRYEPNPQPGSGNLLTANLTLSDGSGSLREYVITVDAIDGKIAVRGGGVTLQQTLTNVLQVKGEDWSRFLSGMYEANMR